MALLGTRLELAVRDSVKEFTGINHFKIFITTLYATYSMSPKNVRQLAKCAAELAVEIRDRQNLRHEVGC